MTKYAYLTAYSNGKKRKIRFKLKNKKKVK